MNFQFQYREFILLMAAIPFFILLFLLLLRWKKRVKKKMGDPKLVRALTRHFSPRLFTAKFLLLSTGFAFGVLALMNPRQPGSYANVQRKGIDLLLALDVSRSMLAADLAPSRLERSKQFITKLMEAMPDDRIGLVLFAGRAYLQMPLTLDHGAARLYVSAAGPDAVPQQGTVIGEALTMAARAFNPKEKRFKSILLISDGEDHDEEAVKVATTLAEQGIMINTVGVGSAEGAPIIDPVTGQQKQDASGATVISRLNENILKQVAAATNGEYLRLESSEEAVEQLKAGLSQIEKKSFEDVSLINYRTFFMWFAGAMLLLLLLEQFIPEKKKQLD